MKPAAFYIPKDWSPESLPEDQREYASYFLNLIHWKWICWQADDEGYVRLRHDYLTQIIPKRIYKKLLVGLTFNEDERQNVVEESGCIVGGPDARARGFRLAERYRKTRRVVCADPKLNAKLWETCEQGKFYESLMLRNETDRAKSKKRIF